MTSRVQQSSREIRKKVLEFIKYAAGIALVRSSEVSRPT